MADTPKKIPVSSLLNGGRGRFLETVKINEPIPRMLRDAASEDLWRMVDIFRGTEHWRVFLRALLDLPQELWTEHKLVPEKARKYFEPDEIGEIVGIYESMSTDGKCSLILFNLNYDKFWTDRVEKTLKEYGLRAAKNVLDRARIGFRANGIPTKASEKCLTDLAAYLRSSKKRKKKK